MVVGMTRQLVKDKGPIMFEALKQIFMEDATAKHRLFVLVAGDGPWESRYKALGPNPLVLGALQQTQLASFSNALDIFANRTPRAQGLDHTLLEAMLCGKPLMATGFKSITGSVVVRPELGYTFSPSVESLKEAVYRVVGAGGGVMEKMEAAARERALKLFTAAKMVAAYETLSVHV